MYEPVASESDTESDCEHENSRGLERRSGIEWSVFVMYALFCIILQCLQTRNAFAAAKLMPLPARYRREKIVCSVSHCMRALKVCV